LTILDLEILILRGKCPPQAENFDNFEPQISILQGGKPAAGGFFLRFWTSKYRFCKGEPPQAEKKMIFLDLM
jgi:hypothetical protein